MTFSTESENSPRFSRDGNYLLSVVAFGQRRGGQVWLLDSSGGEAMELTELRGRLQERVVCELKRMALAIGDPDPNADPNPSPQPGGRHAAKPI